MTPAKPRSRLEEEARRLNALRRDAPQADAVAAAATTTLALTCPRCGLATDEDSGDETSGSSSRWLACNSCGFHWRAGAR